MNDAAAKPGSNGSLLANVHETVRTATDVLSHLESSLQQGGFTAGVSSYQTMCDTLIGQRLWALNAAAEDERLVRSFEELAAVAARIHQVLEPYSVMMGKLRSIGAIEEDCSAATTDDTELDPDAATVLAALNEHGKPMSLSRLRTATGLTRRRLEEVLEQLAGRNAAECFVSRGRRLVWLK